MSARSIEKSLDGKGLMACHSHGFVLVLRFRHGCAESLWGTSRSIFYVSLCFICIQVSACKCIYMYMYDILYVPDHCFFRNLRCQHVSTNTSKFSPLLHSCWEVPHKSEQGQRRNRQKSWTLWPRIPTCSTLPRWSMTWTWTVNLLWVAMEPYNKCTLMASD